LRRRGRSICLHTVGIRKLRGKYPVHGRLLGSIACGEWHILFVVVVLIFT
jgi:hypothetical protein